MGLTKEMLRNNREQFITDSINKFTSQCFYGMLAKTITDRFKNYGCSYVFIELEFCETDEEISRPNNICMTNFEIRPIDPNNIRTIKVLLGYKYKLISFEILDAIAEEYKDIFKDQNSDRVVLGI